MRRRSSTWFLLCLACLIGAFLIWRLSGLRQSNNSTTSTPTASADTASASATQQFTGAAPPTVTSASTAPPAMLAPSQATTNSATTSATPREQRLKYRLSNTQQTVGQLMHSDRAVLLENALIDSTQPLNFSIPDSLKSQGDPGSYIVQSRGPINNAFRTMLQEAGATIVAYIPNNAYLVRMSGGGTPQLSAQVAAVIPFEPYYKLDTTLLKQVMENKPVNPSVNVLVFPDARVATLDALQQLGADVVQESPSPFGTQMVVKNATDVPAIARLPGIQRVEFYSERTPANDLTRPRIGVTTDTTNAVNYLGLTGQGVEVDMNDTGVDSTHPDLVGRVFFLGNDTSGHGTHVAGIIMGDGTESTTVTNAAGSINPGVAGQYRGKAPKATVLSAPIFGGLSDFQLQQIGAQSGARISNNSWTYANRDYDINAASFDAAVRDAIPTATGSQPVLFVFAAGDIGIGDDNGLGGIPETIQSPATAKNVLTVGAIEQQRNITNVVTVVQSGNTNTSQPWLGLTDSSNQVAAFSSRGNVGVAVEGAFGRFKPDLVAPGTFVVSTRSQQWDEKAYYDPTSFHVQTFLNETVATNTIDDVPIFPPISVPDNAVRVTITATPISPIVNLPIYVKENDIPTTADFVGNNFVSIPPDLPLTPGSQYFFRVGNPTNQTVRFNVTVVVTTTNDNGNYFEVLSNLNNSIGDPDWYRYETGTSMSAPAVSGVLALMQEFFQQKSITNSPALMKALLINGARPVNSIYNLQVQNNINYQGWGLVNLTNSIPATFSNQTAIVNPPVNTPMPMLMFDQSPTNALATGEHRTYQVTVDSTAISQPLRATLVWTDPPGNPSAATKLVNNLDLVVTNLDDPSNPLVYFGNDIKANANFNVSWDTNSAPNLDTVNNVENVYISPAIGTNYSITVIARAVNVNAVTDQTNNMVQDYALVISSGNAQVGTALTLLADPGIVTSDAINLTVMTNQFASTSPDIFGQVLGHQRVGANSPLIGTNTVPYQTGNALITTGETNQWHFYLITNSTPFTNAVFATSLPINLAPSRMGVTNTADPSQATRPQADIDLYVTTDVKLLSLDSNAVDLADKSLGRGGYEQVILTNAVPGQVYYIGIKSEDHQAADYTFTSLFSLLPFNNGDNTFPGYPTPANIPDGTPPLPGSVAVTAYAAAEGNTKVRSVTITNVIFHENFGDLVGTLTHDGQKPVVLNSHSPNNNYPFDNVYQDNGGVAIPGTQVPQGPGSLTDYIGDQITGQWSLIEVDNSGSRTGRVDQLTVHIDPHTQDDLPPGATSGIVLRNCVIVQPGSFEYDFVEVPFNGVSVNICLSNAAPMVLYVRNGAVPTLTTYDYIFTNNPVTGCLEVSLSDLPPLQPGNLFFGIYNPNPSAHLVCYTAELTIGPTAVPPILFSSTSTRPILDDAVNFSSIVITNNRTIASAAVGVVLNHPRVSDLVLTLISPLGERFLLYENRGVNETNLGHLNITTNFFGTQTAGAAQANTNILGPVPTTGTLLINYNFFTVPDSLDVYYDGVDIFSTGLINGAGQFVIPYGPGVGNTITIVMNQGGNPNSSTAWVYTPEVVALDYTYLTFTEDPRQASTAIKFARPPFDLANSGTNFPLSDFELATNGNYLASTNVYDAFGGWNLFSNRFEGTNLVIITNNLVSVVTDTNTAQSGSNYLALGLGTIVHTNIPTTPGRKYTFGYWYRGPGISGWWRGEGNALDSADPEALGNNGSLVGSFTFPEGEVGQSFQFGGTNGFDAQQQLPGQSYVQVPQSPSLNVGGGSGLTVEGWINPTNIFIRQPLVEWLAPIPTNWVPVVAGETNSITTDTNLVPVGGPFLNPTTGHYYYLLPSTNWTRSEQWANALGGHLATVEDANEENWIYDLFSQYGRTNRTLWIGLNDAATPGTFAWAGGQTSMFYTNWANGQPSNTCFPNQHYVAILNPTNTQASLWTLADNNGDTCGFPPTNRIHGVVEVEEIQTNGVQFWVSVTNNTITGTGRLYADLVDTNNVSHIIYSAPGLLQTNGMQHVALTYDRASGIAALYYSGTNVATTNLGVFMPKTGGDVLIGKHMSRETNSVFVGRMDEVSIYNRFLSAAEIAAIYDISISSSNHNIGKFDQSITPALGLAEAQVSIGGVTNTILGANTKWQISTYTFTATTNYIPMQVAGIEPGMLLDSFTVSEAPLGNLYYLPETFLSDLVNQSVQGTWTLEIRDSRAGPADTNTVGQLISWQMQFIYQNNAPTAVPLSPFEPSTNNVPAGKTAYFTVDVPLWATSATNILVSSTSPVDLLFNQTTPPTGVGAGDIIMLPASTGGVGLPILVTNAVPPLLPGLRYYLGVRNRGAAAATVVVQVDYNITTLSNSVPVASHFATNEFLRYFAFDVSSNAVEATFQLLKLSNNVDLVVRRGVPLPTLTSSDYGSFNAANADENIYVQGTNSVSTNAPGIPLLPGRWYLGVIKRDPVADFSILAKELDPPLPTIIELTNNVPFTFTTGPGAALTNFFHFEVADNTTNTTAGSVHFELYNMSGNGDLTVQTNVPPFAPTFWQSGQQPGVNPELVFIQTNSVLTNLSEVDWYLGVPNHETNLITYTILAVIDTNGYFPAFPGAEGAGGGATGGGRVGLNGDVYHVTTLSDSGPGSLRDAVSAANRTVVFDVSGIINLASPLKITVTNLTIAGQTAPGDGITVRGWVTSVQNTHDVIVRYMRFRPGDINCPLNQDDAFHFDFASDSIADHVSASWSIDEVLSATDSTNITVQWSMITDSLNNSCHVKGLHGYGSLLRYGYGALSFHHNLYADNYSRNPRLGDNISLDFVNNVIYNWGLLPGYSEDDSLDNPLGFTNYLNYVNNYLITGPDFVGDTNVLPYIAFLGGSTNTWIFQTNNVMDANTNGILDGARTGWGMFTNEYTGFGRAFPAQPVSTDEGFIAYEKVLDFAGASLFSRDRVDDNIVIGVRTQTGTIINTPPLSGLVSLWPGEGNANDVVGPNNGIPQNVTYASGEVGRAFALDGFSSSIRVPASPSLNVGLGGGFTFEAWINTADFSFQSICEWNRNGGTGTGGFSGGEIGTHLELNEFNGDGSLWGNIIDSSGNPHVVNTSGGVITTNGWQHVAITYDKATGAAVLYRNGVVVAAANLGVFTPQTSSDFFMGTRPAGPFAGLYFHGGIDEPSLYNRALTATEVKSIYNAGSAGKNPSPFLLLPLDTDRDGMPDYWEITLGENPTNASNNLDRDGDGYTDLEEYINWLGVPHALTVTNTPVGVDLFQLFGNTGNLSFAVTNPIQGFVYLTNVLDAVTNVVGSTTNVIGAVTNTGPYSNSFAIFTPTNNLPFTTNYSGYASFDVYVTNNDTIAYFGPVKVSVMVSAVPIIYASPNTNAPPVLSTNLPNLTNNEQTTIIVTNTATDANTNLILSYTVTLTIDTNAMIANGWPLNYATTVPAPTIDTNGIITWTPSEAQGPGVYIITTVVSDNGIPSLQAANSFTVTVNEVNRPPFWPPGVPSQTNYVITVATPLTVINTAADLDVPPNPLSYALTVAPPVGNAVISSNGIITWTTPPPHAPGLYTFTTVVTDTNQFAVNAKSLSATNVFTVLVIDAAAPFVFTQPAQAVTGTSARLNGMVTPNGLPTTAWYEWGTNTSYGNFTTAANVGNSFNVVYTPSPIINLITNTAYHFRLVASNALGITFGFDQILDEANVVVWGANYVGQANVPAGLSNVVAIAGAYDHSLALKNNGTVVGWGDNFYSQSTVPPGLNSSLVAVAGGESYSLALKSSGTVVAWGADIYPGAGETNVPAGLNNVVMIASGRYSSLALKNSGALVAWGASLLNPTNLPPGLSNMVSIAGGTLHSLAIKNDGTVVAWGDSGAGQTNVPVGLTNVVAIAAGSFHSLALKYDGTVVAWGYDIAGQTDVPAGLNNVVAVAAGSYTSMALKSDGTVVTWGDNSAGQSSVPVGLSNVVAIASGNFHSMALTPLFLINSTNIVILDLTNGVPQTNGILAGGLIYYRVHVPTNADFATNSLLFAFNGPLNVWYSTNTPPSITNVNDLLLLPGVTNGVSILSTNSVPAYLIPGSIYYLGVQNTNNFTVTYGIEVDFHFTLPPGIITLTNMIPYANSNSAAGNATDYYRFVVSSNSARAQFEVDNPSGDVTLVVSRGLPLPSLGSYDYISADAYTNMELIVVLTNSTVSLTPGDWFISVVNVSGGPVTYSVKASEWPVTGLPVNITDISFSPTNVCITWDSLIGAYYYVQGVTTLTSTNWVTISPSILATNTSTTYCVPLPSPYSFFRVLDGIDLSQNIAPTIVTLTNLIPYSVTGSAGTNGLDYYRYNVSANASSVRFEVLSPSGNVTLLARYGQPLPSLGLYDYISANGGTSNELILVLTNSLPVPLTPGGWYLAVSNASGSPVSYTVLVAEVTNTPPTIITLTNMIGYANSNSGAGQATDSYRFVVSSNSARAQFEVDNPSGDVTLVVRRGLPLPSLSSYDYISTNSFTNTELIVVLTNSSPIALAPGDWYLSVVNVSGGPVTYSVKASEWPVTGLPVNITDISFSPTNVCITWDSLIGAYYYVQGVTTLTSTNWVTISPTILATNTSTTYCVPLPSPYNFFRVQEGLVLSTNLPLLPTIIDLTNGVPYLNANAGGTNTVDYYRYVVTTNAARAQFEVNNASGDVVLMARKGLPLPTLGNYDYVSTNSFTNDELIVIFTNSIPALAPGDWYLAVSNASGSAITYAVKATEWPTTGLPVDVTDISFSPTNVCITWDSLIGAHYYVQGVTTLTSTNWTTISPTILATNTSTTYCVPLPSPYSFFRVQEGLVLSTNAATSPVITLTNATPYLKSNLGGINPVDYYRFVVSTNSARAQFEVNNPSGDVVLMVRKGLPLPTLGNYNYISTNSFTNDELIVVFTNSTPALAPGDWYLAVSNASGSAITYAVKATEWPTTGLPVDITDISFSPTNVCITWDSLIGAHYYVQGLTSLGSTNWVTISATILATNASTTYCVPLPSLYNFFRVEEGLVLSTNTATSPIVITLTNASAYLNSNLGGVNPVDYYRFVVSTNSARAQFEVNNPGGDVTLMARNGLPLPTLANAGYLSQNPSTNDELIVVFTNSLLVALTPGDWYLAVSNASGGAVTYSVKATEWPVTGVPIGISNISVSSGSICLTWNSLAGVHYYVQGLTSLSSTNWTLASPPILATNATTTYCITLPSPYSYFRVEEGLAPVTPVIVPPPVISAIFTNSGFLLRWNGPISAQYKVQWASNLPPSWNLFTNIIASGSGQFSFFDDGSQTAGLGVARFYRVMAFP